MAFAETANLAVKLTLGGNFTSQMGKAQSSLQKFDKGFGRIAGGAGKLSSGFAKAGTVIAAGIGTAFVGVAKAAIDFEDAYQGVVKTVDETDLKSAGLSFDKLRASIRTMATEIPISAVELSNLAANAGALGIKAKDIEAFTRTVAILGVTTNVTAEDASTALGQLQNAMGLTGDEFDNFASALVNLGNKGASTEGKILEVSGRIAATAKNIGLSKSQTLAWGAALANLPDLPELSGTAGQLFFSQVQRITATGKGLKQLAGIAGKTGKDAGKKFATNFKKDPSSALQSFLRGLAKLPKDQRLLSIDALFGKRSGLARIISELADSMDRNLNPALHDADEAWKSQTAHIVEFEKRNKTVRSSLQLLKNNVIEAALTIGGDPNDPKSFIGSIGGAAKKLTEFLKDSGNKKALEDIGKQLGEGINGIDWNAVLKGGKEMVGVLRSAFDWAKRIYDLFSALPTEVKGAAAGLLLLNKASGGLIGGGIGDIVGGLGSTLAKSLAASIPFFGKAFVQPVYVTNIGALGPTGGGDLLGTAAKGGILAAATSIATGIAAAAGIIVGAKVVTDAIDPGLGRAVNHEPGAGTPLGNRDPRRLNSNGQVVRNVLPPQFAQTIGHAVAAAIRDHDSGPQRTNEQTKDRDQVPARQATVKVPAKLDALQAKAQQTAAAVKDMDSSVVNSTSAAAARTVAGQNNAAARTVAGQYGAAGQIVAAVNGVIAAVNGIHISATSVNKTTTVVQRYGPPSGTRDSPARDGDKER